MKPPRPPHAPGATARSAARGWRRWLRPPAVRALLIQALAYLCMLTLVYLLARQQFPVSLAGAALLQGLFAALLTYGAGLASWWCLIGLLFPLALLGASALHLPPPVFLAAFVFLLGLYWSTFRTQVPFYPSHPAVWAAVAAELPPPSPGKSLRLLDIGSGLGGLVLDLARRRPDLQCTGIELAPLPWLLSRLRARLSGSRARFVRGDYEALDFAGYDVVFAYLSPAAMPRLWQQATAQMRPATVLFSYEFIIAAKTPDKTIAATPVGPALYVWYF